MENSNDISEEQFWKETIKKHTNAFIVMIVAAVFLIIGAILTLFWIIEVNPFVDPQTGFIGNWTLNYIVGFFIQLILAELLFVGAPAALFFGLGGYIWWSKLPTEDQEWFKARNKKEKHRKQNWGGGGGFGFFMFIAYCIYIAADGNYNTPIGNKPWGYWVYSWFLTLMWILILLGIPALIILIIVYFTYWKKK
ncbi:MAG: hypothetical protein ACFFCE_15075 [Promethearchaeota archaeon]